jgi:hypothetical protein
MSDDVTVRTHINAPADALYDMVSDVTRMGEWSPETTSCRWLGDDRGPAVGARFRGVNRIGWRRWSTTCTVVAADPGRRFAFDVDFGPMPIARWSYEFVPDGDGTRVAETWTDRRPRWITPFTPLTGVRSRPAHNRAGMETTLARLREAAQTRV